MSNEAGENLSHLRSLLGAENEVKKPEKGSSFYFRVDDELKRAFLNVCQDERISVSAALRRYMIKCVRAGNIDQAN